MYGPLNEDEADKIRQYRADYDNHPINAISFMSVMTGVFVRLLFLQTHRETDRFFEVSGDRLTQSTSDQCHYRLKVFSSNLKSKVGNILTKVSSFWITLNIDGTPIDSKSHTHPSHSETSSLLTSSLSLGVPVPHTT